jgi:hypothetical protein
VFTCRGGRTKAPFVHPVAATGRVTKAERNGTSLDGLPGLPVNQPM